MKTHTQEDLFSCDRCNRIFILEKYLLRHNDIHHKKTEVSENEVNHQAKHDYGNHFAPRQFAWTDSVRGVPGLTRERSFANPSNSTTDISDSVGLVSDGVRKKMHF